MAYTYRATSIYTSEVVEGTAEHIGKILFSNKYSVGEAANKNRLLANEWRVECTGKEIFKRVCAGCGKEFETTYGHKLYCSTKCNNAVQDAKKANDRREAKKMLPAKNKRRKIQSMSEVQRLARADGRSYADIQKQETLQMIYGNGFWSRSMG